MGLGLMGLMGQGDHVLGGDQLYGRSLRMLQQDLPRLMTVGRLDLDSEGLLLMTNDGDLARHLELPSTGWSRKYRVRAQGQINESQLAALADGVIIDGIRYGQVIAKLDRQMASNAWLTVAIREGKNREIRRIMEYLGHKVSRLIRISYGPFQLGDLEDGAIEQVKARVLAEQPDFAWKSQLLLLGEAQSLRIEFGGRLGARFRPAGPRPAPAWTRLRGLGPRAPRGQCELLFLDFLNLRTNFS